MVERNMTNYIESARDYEFEQPVVSIGSHPDNDITIDDSGVLPFHAAVVLEAGQFRLIPMESGSQMSVEGVPVQGQVILETSQRLEIGSHALFFQHNGTSDSIHVKLFPIAAEKDFQQYTVEGDESAILLNILSDEAEIDVEQTATFEFEVVNAGPIVASFFVSLKGVPEKWIEISPAVINLNEGQRHIVQVKVTPPRDASSQAGTHELQLMVTSPNYGAHRGLAKFSLTIKPYYEFILGNLSPRNQRISYRKRTGKTFLPITNKGNGSADFNILAVDDENGCSFDFQLEDGRQLNRQATTQLEAGESIEVPLEITPIKRPMFSMRSKRYHYTTSVQIPQSAEAPQTMSGSATSVPLFGWWSIVLGVITILAAMFFILQPNIRSFEVAAGKDVIELGDTTRLDWNVSPFATNLTISNIDPPVTRGQVSVTVAPTKSTTYELVSSNWLSGLVGLDQKRTVTVLVVPPSPHINVFDVDRTKITQGQPVNIRWSVSNADEAFLTIDQVVYPLTPEEFSGERQVVLEKDALITLEAKTASGSELQSSFVNVQPPYIDISTFTVWVRPDSLASNPDQSPVAMTAGGKRFSMVNSPDPNFPIKFVELIPDVNSDNGYRVQFNPAIRTELNKGEQVLLEWNVEGVDSLQIAPFTDALPARGSQPFFPQESMNFVMTAKSGDLEGIFMLPVKVFDGIPPTAPKIEFFRGAPLQMVGPGSVELSWSISGEWTRVSLSNAEGIIADNLNPVGFKTIPVTQSSTIILTAYNGELTSAMPLEIVVDPALIQIGLSITSVTPQGGSNELLVGGNAIVSVGFYSDPLDPLSAPPTPDPTGKILVSDGISSCEITLPATSCALTFATPGSPKQIKASYAGDSVYASASSDVDESISVISAKVNLTATFFRLDKDTNGAGTPIGENITTTQFTITDGLFIQVNVIPINTVFPDDNMSWITVKFCPSDATTGPDLTQCTSLLTVPVNIIDGQPGGVAYVPIESFPSAGLNALYIEYQHQQYVIDTTHIVQDGLNIDKLDIKLSLPSCTSPDSLQGCTLGTSQPTNATVTFDLKDALTLENLSVLLPIPVGSAYTLSLNSDLSSPWSCSVDQQGSYKLKCTGVNFGTYGNEYPVYYSFGTDPVYNLVPATGSFNLTVARQTAVSFDTTTLSGARVGQLYKFAGPISGTATLLSDSDRVINLVDPSNQTNLITGTTGNLIVTLPSEGMVGKSAASTGCSIIGSQIIITSMTSLCEIYFNHIGSNIAVTVEYEGDFNNAGGQTSVQVSIQKQTQVLAGWEDWTGSAYESWNKSSLAPNTLLKIRTVLTAISQTPVFEPLSLVGRKVTVTVDIKENPNTGLCNLYAGDGTQIGSTPTTTGTTPFQVTITSATSSAVADFGLVCTQEAMDVQLSIAFSTDDQTDLAFDTTAVKEQSLFIAPTGNFTLNLDIKRSADAVNAFANSSSFKTFYFGEPYVIKATVGNFWIYYDVYNSNYFSSYSAAYSHFLNIPVTIDIPDSLVNRITVSGVGCSYAAGSNTINMKMNKVNEIYKYDYTTYGYAYISLTNTAQPCSLTISPTGGVFAVSTDKLNFTYSATTYYTSILATTGALSMANGADRQPVSLTFGSPVVLNTGTYYLVTPKNVSTSFIATVVPTVANTSLVPIAASDDDFTFSVPPGCTGMTTPTQLHKNDTQSTLTVLFPNSCSGQILGVVYGGNTYFKSVNSSINVTANDPTSTTLVLTASPVGSTLLGSQVTLTGTISTGGGIHPAGNIQFKIDGVNLGSTHAVNANGVATATTSSMTAGSHNLTAVFTPSDPATYAGDTSDTVSYTIKKPTTISVASNQSGTYYGQSVTFTATVSSTEGTPTGSIQFMSSITGAIGASVNLTESVAGVSTASLVYSNLPVGDHTITAVYTPTNYFDPKTGTLRGTYTVTAATTTTALVMSPTSGGTAYFGDTVTFTVNVTVTNGGGNPTGTISVYSGNGSTLLGSAALVAGDGGQKVISLDVDNTAPLTFGTYNNIDARFTGTNYANSSSTPKQSLTVAAATTSTTLDITPTSVLTSPGPTNPVDVSYNVTVAITNGAGTPVGTIKIFKTGDVQIGSTANLVLADAGEKTITITYSATETITGIYASFTSSSANITGSDNHLSTQTVYIQ